jgi:hypothetical protein
MSRLDDWEETVDRRMRSLLVTLSVSVALLATTASSAPAASYFHAGTASGNVLAAGTGIGAHASNWVTISMDAGTLQCFSSDFYANVGASGGALSISVSFSSWNFRTCTDTLPIITIDRCDMVQPKATATASAYSSSGGAFTVNNAYFRCSISAPPQLPGKACYYHLMTASGTYYNSVPGITFPPTSIDRQRPSGATGDLGSSVCGNYGSFTTTYSPIYRGGVTPVVYLNNTP